MNVLQKNFTYIILLNILGFSLFFSWHLLPDHGFWKNIDALVFQFSNQLVLESHTLANTIIFTNRRFFDAVSFLAMGTIYLVIFIKQDSNTQKKMIAIGISMLICALVLSQLGHLIPVKRTSPTWFFPDSIKICELTVSSCKDASKDSFPGDHGLVLMIFTAYMLRYFSRKTFFLSALLVVLFSLPRIMSGAHWFTDVYVGSFSIACIGMSWWLLTPACDRVISGINKLMPKKFCFSDIHSNHLERQN